VIRGHRSELQSRNVGNMLRAVCRSTAQRSLNGIQRLAANVATFSACALAKLQGVFSTILVNCNINIDALGLAKPVRPTKAVGYMPPTVILSPYGMAISHTI